MKWQNLTLIFNIIISRKGPHTTHNYEHEETKEPQQSTKHVKGMEKTNVLQG